MADQPINPLIAVATGMEVTARYIDGEAYETGRIVGYYDQPTFVIESPDGTKFSWIASLVSPAVITCGETEGVTGIDCDQPKGHEGDHEGTTNSQQTENVGYPMTVRWPRAKENSRA